MKIANVKALVAKVLTIGFVAGALVIAAPAKAQAQVGFGIRFGAPVAPVYGGYYRDDDRFRHEEFERREAFARQQEFERQQAWARHEAWERHERWEHGGRDFDRFHDGYARR